MSFSLQSSLTEQRRIYLEETSLGASAAVSRCLARQLNYQIWLTMVVFDRGRTNTLVVSRNEWGELCAQLGGKLERLCHDCCGN
jgi:hypothetical protein